MNGKEFIDKYVSKEMAQTFSTMDYDERKKVIEAMGGYCSQCGGHGDWCCYDTPWDD